MIKTLLIIFLIGIGYTALYGIKKIPRRIMHNDIKPIHAVYRPIQVASSFEPMNVVLGRAMGGDDRSSYYLIGIWDGAIWTERAHKNTQFCPSDGAERGTLGVDKILLSLLKVSSHPASSKKNSKTIGDLHPTIAILLGLRDIYPCRYK